MNSLLPSNKQAALLQPVGGPRHNTAVKENLLLIFILRKIGSIVRKKNPPWNWYSEKNC
jgi:hypothetical protein